jgi:glyceraldehyde 3-phosphate dehydrogenase
MSYRVAINGFGRISRDYLRCVLERDLLGTQIEVVAINDLWDPATLAHLLTHDSTLGKLRWDVDDRRRSASSDALATVPDGRIRPSPSGP